MNFSYSVMAGMPEKIVEYLLETRIDAQSYDGLVDTFLEDFILTHIIHMPVNILCSYLKNYYMRGPTVCFLKKVFSCSSSGHLKMSSISVVHQCCFFQLYISTLAYTSKHNYCGPFNGLFLI